MKLAFKDHPNKQNRVWRKTSIENSSHLLAAFLFGVLATLATQHLLSSSSSSCTIFLGTYKGKEYIPPSRQQRKCLVESKFLKVQQHTVQIDNNNMVHDWLWIDYHDRINVIVQLANKDFLVFYQTKYALQNQYSLAIVGGIVEPGEDPAVAASREVQEETHHECVRFVPLGKYRTDVNRGMGWTFTYLAQGCSKMKKEETRRRSLQIQHPPGDLSANNENNPAEEVGGRDTERQDIRIMNREDVRKAVQNGEFMEIQWCATVALALLHTMDDHHPAPHA